MAGNINYLFMASILLQHKGNNSLLLTVKEKSDLFAHYLLSKAVGIPFKAGEVDISKFFDVAKLYIRG